MAYVTHFAMKLRRVYTYRGRRHSFISAGCGLMVDMLDRKESQWVLHLTRRGRLRA